MTVFYIFAAVFFVASVVVHIFLSEDPRMAAYGDFIAALVAILPVITSIYVFMYFGKGSPERTVWLILTAGLILWFFGESLWFYYDIVKGVDPFPSLADALWIFGYPCFMAALIIWYKTVNVRLKKYELGFAALVLVIAVVAFFLFGYMITAEEEFTLLEKVVSLFYPAGDLLLLFLALLIAALYRAGKLGYSWILIALGIIFYAGGDLWYAYLEWMEIYPELSWHPVDFTWIIGDLLVFLGAAKYRISFEELT